MLEMCLRCAWAECGLFYYVFCSQFGTPPLPSYRCLTYSAASCLTNQIGCLGLKPRSHCALFSPIIYFMPVEVRGRFLLWTESIRNSLMARGAFEVCAYLANSNSLFRLFTQTRRPPRFFEALRSHFEAMYHILSARIYMSTCTHLNMKYSFKYSMAAADLSLNIEWREEKRMESWKCLFVLRTAFLTFRMLYHFYITHSARALNIHNLCFPMQFAHTKC